MIRSTHNIGVRGAHFEVLFSVLNGGLVSYKYAGKEMIEAIPKPNFWRAPTDNDCGNLMRNALCTVEDCKHVPKSQRLSATESYGPDIMPEARSEMKRLQ